MCHGENLSLQKGMNYSSRSDHSVLLMSLRKALPIKIALQDNGLTLIYEGHDASRGGAIQDSKKIDQPQYLPSGKLTENGKFFEAALRYKNDGDARLVRVYEKLRDGIWPTTAISSLWTRGRESWQAAGFQIQTSCCRSQNSTARAFIRKKRSDTDYCSPPATSRLGVGNDVVEVQSSGEIAKVHLPPSRTKPPFYGPKE